MQRIEKYFFNKAKYNKQVANDFKIWEKIQNSKF